MKKKIWREKRKYKRFPVLDEFATPVDLSLSPVPASEKKVLSGILVNLSAGGGRLITFASIPLKTALVLSLNLPPLGKTILRGKIVWVKEKKGIYSTGIAFTRISKKTVSLLKKMGEDYHTCRKRILAGEKFLCRKRCSYRYFCDHSPEKK